MTTKDVEILTVFFKSSSQTNELQDCHTIKYPLYTITSLYLLPSVYISTQSIRSVSGEGHLNGSFPPPKEASTRNRLLIYTDTPIQINSETLVTPAITEDILSYKVRLLCNL
jgi:hypothetical protein